MKKTRTGKRKTPKVPPKAKILRTTHVHRARAHTTSAGRRQQARRDK